MIKHFGKLGRTLTSKFMMSQPGSQTIGIHISLIVSQSKGNQTIKLSQLIEYEREVCFFENYADNEARD